MHLLPTSPRSLSSAASVVLAMVTKSGFQRIALPVKGREVMEVDVPADRDLIVEGVYVKSPQDELLEPVGPLLVPVKDSHLSHSRSAETWSAYVERESSCT